MIIATTFRLLEVKAERHYSREPETAHHDCDPVQVLLHDGRTTIGRGNSAAEEIGEAASLALMEQNQKDHEDARDHLNY